MRVYIGARRRPMKGVSPEDHAAEVRKTKSLPERFAFVETGVVFHSPVKHQVPDFLVGECDPRPFHGALDSALSTEGDAAPDRPRRGREGRARERGGPRPRLPTGLDAGGCDPLRSHCRASNLMWPEDMLGADRVPYVVVALYAELARSTSRSIHTGERICLRQNFEDLVERKAARILGPDPRDRRSIAQLERTAEFAHLHGVTIAPHGTGNGLLGLGALVQVCATRPVDFIAFEYPTGGPDWRYDIAEGVPLPIVEDARITVCDRPGIGVEIVPVRAACHLFSEDAGLFDRNRAGEQGWRWSLRRS